MKKRRTLESLIDREFAEGHEGFREVVDFVNSDIARELLPAKERAMVRLMELVHVAMIEGVNECVEDYGLDDLEALVTIWAVTGMSLACLNGQGMTTMFGAVRKEMLATLTANYNATAKDLVARADEGGAA